MIPADRCRAEMRQAEEWIAANPGHRDQVGATIGYLDWAAELALIEEDMETCMTKEVLRERGECNSKPRSRSELYFGGKSRVADVVWDRFGDVPNYIEPFFGSGAVLLARPHEPRVETVNDADCMISNFWRAIKNAPAEVAEWADWPVNEADLHARHLWLVNQPEFVERMKTDPDHYDPKIAGWWVWGISQWIGGGWCAAPNSSQNRHLGRADGTPQRSHPVLRHAGDGIHAKRLAIQIPNLGRSQGVHRKRPDCHSFRGVSAKGDGIYGWFDALAYRLRNVRVCCGDWARITGPSPTWKIGLTGVFLDPPYSADRDEVYNHDSRDVAHDVRAWCIENGGNPLLRIALCGYEGEHDLPGWDCVAWKAVGGYGSQGTGLGRENARKERIWFSPSCIKPPSLFD